MPTEKEMQVLTKAVAYDLTNIFESNPDKESYTPEEIKTIIKAYVEEVTK